MKNVYRPYVLVAVSFFSLWLTGCTTRVRGVAYADVPGPCCAEPELVAVQPELVEIHPDLWVVCDHHSAAYFHYGAYWHYESGVWWQSSTWGGPRVRVHVHGVPSMIVVQDHRAHVRFRGHGHAKRRHGAVHAKGHTKGHYGGHGAAQGATAHRPAAHRTGAHRASRPTQATHPSRRPAARQPSHPKARPQRPVARPKRPAMKRARPVVHQRSRTEPKRRPSVVRRPTTVQRRGKAAPTRAVDKRPRRPARQDGKRDKRRSRRR